MQQDTSLKTFAGVIEGLVKSIKDVDAISVESFAERVSLFRKYIGGLEKHEKDEELKKHRKELTDIGHQMGKWGGLLERELLYQYLKQKGARLQISLKQRALHGFPYAVLRGLMFFFPFIMKSPLYLHTSFLSYRVEGSTQ